MSARQGRRSRHITARLSRNPELRKQVGGHQSVLVEREAILNRERSLLRQVGDAIAWLVLRTDPAIIGPLWAPGRTHYLPTGIGLDAPVQIIRDLNASGEFFAVFNDLTRCLGVGDITVVPANTPWPVPLSMELKAKQVDDVGSQAEIDFLSPHSDEPEFAALFQSVRVCLGLKDRGQPTTDSRAQRQIDELLERTDLLFRMRGRLATRLPPPGSNHWGSIRQLLNNSYTNGSAFDFPRSRSSVLLGPASRQRRSGTSTPACPRQSESAPTTRDGRHGCLNRRPGRIAIICPSSPPQYPFGPFPATCGMPFLRADCSWG